MPSLSCSKSKPSSKQECGYWGYHLILDCKHCDTAKLKDGANILAFVKALVPAIDMTAYGEPVLAHFATHNPHAAGYSLVQLIETSSITGHFAEHIGDAYIDIFSCKPFDLDVAKQVVTDFFAPEQIKTFFLTRQA